MKHAWLIIAHNEFEILRLLVGALDDPDNDIYLHIDKKVKSLPDLHAEKSRLTLLTDRLDVRWGARSQIDCELLLMKHACEQGRHDRYHIISGTHLPLQPMPAIHAFFEERPDCELMHLWERDDRDIGNKLQRYNFFVKGFTSRSAAIRRLSQFGWSVLQFFQKRLKVARYPGKTFIKSDNWVSLTEKAVRYLVEHTGTIRKKYRFTYCGDEYFVATELSESPESFRIVDTDKLLKTDFVRYNPRIYTTDDADALLASDCLFARKFSAQHLDVAQRILNRIEK